MTSGVQFKISQGVMMKFTKTWDEAVAEATAFLDGPGTEMVSIVDYNGKLIARSFTDQKTRKITMRRV